MTATATFAPFTSADATAQVVFRDAAHPAPSELVHVVGSRKMHQIDVTINGVLIPGVKDADMSFGIEQATRVILWVDPQLCDVAAPFRSESEVRWIYGGLEGMPLLTPYRGVDSVCGWVWDKRRNLVECEFLAERVVFE